MLYTVSCWKCYSQIEGKSAYADAEGNILHKECYTELKCKICSSLTLFSFIATCIILPSMYPIFRVFLPLCVVDPKCDWCFYRLTPIEGKVC